MLNGIIIFGECVSALAWRIAIGQRYWSPYARARIGQHGFHENGRFY